MSCFYISPLTEVGLPFSAQSVVISWCVCHSFLSICPALSIVQAIKHEMFTQHLPDIGSVSACTLWTHHRQQKALSSVEWLMARAVDGGPTLKRHWVDMSCLLGIVGADRGPLSYPANTGFSHNAVSMLANHLCS